MSSDSGTYDLALWSAEPMTSGVGSRWGAAGRSYAPAGRTRPDS
jgi:hypothetical protein